MHLLIKLISSPWFWVDVFFGTIGALIVVKGLTLESRAEKLEIPEDFKPDLFQDIINRQKALLRRGEKLVLIGCLIEAIASFVLSIISGLEIADLNDNAARAEQDAAVAKSQTISNEMLIGVFSTNLITLAHEYDLSTNALAEANARLASIRPLKARLIAFLNGIDPSILTALASGKTDFRFVLEEYKYGQLDTLISEPGSGEYCSSMKVVGNTFNFGSGGGMSQGVNLTVELTLKPQLAR